MFIRFTCLDDYTGKIQDKKKTIISKEDRELNFDLFYKCFKKLNIQVTASLLQQYLFKYINNPLEVIENINELKDLYNSTTDENKELYS